MIKVSPSPRSNQDHKGSMMSVDSGSERYIEHQRHPSVEGNLKVLQTIECQHDVMCCRFSPDGAVLAVGLSDGYIKIYNMENGHCFFSLSDPDILQSHLPCTSIHFPPVAEDAPEEHKHILQASYASGFIKFWHYTSGSCLHTIDEQRQTLASAIDPAGSMFLTSGSDPGIHVYDEKTKQLIRKCEPSDSKDVMNGHRLRVFALQFHPVQPNIFVSGGWDDTLQFWDTREKHSIRKIYGPHICGDALDIDPVHNHIITGSWRKEHTLQIWDFANGTKIKDIPEEALHSSQLYCAQWLGKDSILCGGCDQNMARVIDRGTLNTTGQLIDLPQAVFCVDNDRQAVNPKMAVGAACSIYLLRCEQKK